MRLLLLRSSHTACDYFWPTRMAGFRDVVALIPTSPHLRRVSEMLGTGSWRATPTSNPAMSAMAVPWASSRDRKSALSGHHGLTSANRLWGLGQGGDWVPAPAYRPARAVHQHTAGVAGPGDVAGAADVNPVIRALEAATGIRRALAPAGCLGLSQAAAGNLGAVCTGP